MTSAAFFDFGDTLGAVRVSAADTGIKEIAVHPGVLDALTAPAAALRYYHAEQDETPLLPAAPGTALRQSGGTTSVQTWR